MLAGTSHVGSGDSAAERVGLRHVLISAMGLAVLLSGPAPCADWDPGPTTVRLRMPDPLLSLRDMYPDLATSSAGRGFSHDFQSRASAFPAWSPGAESGGAVALEMNGRLPQTSVWQRMGDFRTEDGIRLLTFWQTAGSTVALHQRNGGAALQWTSHALNRGGASRGLLDHLFTAVRGTRAPVRAATMSAPSAPALAARFASP